VTTENITLDDTALDALFREARTPNAFTDDPVSDEQLHAIFELAKWGPTSMNSQPLRVVVVKSEPERAALVAAMSDGNKPKTQAAPLSLVFAMDRDFHEHLPTQFPAVPAAHGMLDGIGRGGRQAPGMISASLQIAYWIMAVRSQGLAIGPMGGFDRDAVDAHFFPGGRFTSLVVANIGHPDHSATYPRGPRLGFDEVVTVR